MSLSGRSGWARGQVAASTLLGVTVSAFLGLAGCSAAARVAQTAFQPSESAPESPSGGAAGRAGAGDGASPSQAGEGGSGGSAAVSCPAGLVDRLSVTSVELSRDVRYKSPGQGDFPFDERVAFAPASDGSAYVAWLDNASGGVRVTPLDASFARRGQDIDTRSWDIGGIVARGGGFALLSLRDDPEPLLSRNGNVGRAVFMLRYRAGQEAFAVQLTGTRSITRKVDAAARDFAPGYLYGRLQWNGAKYGAYFVIFTAQSDPRGALEYPTDKLVYLDDSGALLRGGFRFKCDSDQGLRMWPEPDVYTPVCLSTGAPGPGLILGIEDQPPQLLASEAAVPGWSGGQLGSIVKLADNSYVLGWLSRDVAPASPSVPLRRASDVAMLRLNSERQPMGGKRWLIETPNLGETNLHFARYGSSRVLMVWDRMDNLRCGNADRLCFGRYAGTFARVLDADGNTLIPDTQIAAVPNSYEDLHTLEDGSVAWAYVPDEARDYSGPISTDQNGDLLLPAKRRIAIARLRYCE